MTARLPIQTKADRFGRGEVEQSLATRFEAQVHRWPERTAISDGDHRVSYRELDRHANRIAHALLVHAPGPAVALLMEHGPLVPAAVLGVLKAARCYVALHPEHPLERNARMLAHAQARVLLTDRARSAAARDLVVRLGGSIAVVDVEGVDGGSSAPAGVAALPHDPCSIVYTSGSTGTPKGVVQLHRNILFGCWTYANLAGLDETDRLSWMHSIGTIAGSTTLCGALMNGGTLCPIQPQRAGLQALAAWIDRERISVLHLVPTLFRRLAQHLSSRRRFEHVRLLRLGGEAVTATEAALFRTHCRPSSGLLVGLGSSEAGSYRQSVYPWDAVPADPVLPAGDPVPERLVTLIGPDGAPVGPGEAGEIVVSSEFLFASYWRQPGLTAAALAADPDDCSRRRFRTGDLGRIAPDGRFFHVGRSDTQVKIAGQRVEVAEIEHALRAIAPIRDAAVVPVLSRDGVVSLTAFVANTAAAPAPSPRQLRAALRAVVPAHMIPRRFAMLEELPVLCGGKIDRVALRAQAVGDRPLPTPPRNPVEETMAAIWGRALSLRGIGVEEDFVLDLGGDSLAAVQILADVREVFGRELPLETFAAAPTVAALSARVSDAAWTPPDSGVLTMHADGARPPLFAICGAFGHALRFLLIAQRLGPDQPFHALQPPGMDWARAGCRTFSEMAAHYCDQIRRIQPRGPYRLLGTSLGGIMAFEVALQLQRARGAVALLAMVDTMPPDCVVPGGIDRACRRDWTAGAVAADQFAVAGARVAKAHRAAMDGYLLRDCFDGAILYFRCRDAAVPSAGDRRGLWARFATRGIVEVSVPGIHGQFHLDPQCAAVVAGLERVLVAGTASHAGCP